MHPPSHPNSQEQSLITNTSLTDTINPPNLHFPHLRLHNPNGHRRRRLLNRRLRHRLSPRPRPRPQQCRRLHVHLPSPRRCRIPSCRRLHLRRLGCQEHRPDFSADGCQWYVHLVVYFPCRSMSMFELLCCVFPEQKHVFLLDFITQTAN